MEEAAQSKHKFFTVKAGDIELRYTLARSRRKTIGIAIDKNGLIKVTSPFGVSESYINELIQKKLQWILKKLAELEAHLANGKTPKLFQDGEKFLYLGKELELKITYSNYKKAYTGIKGESIIIDAPTGFNLEAVKHLLRLWYIEQFRQIAVQRIEHYSAVIGVFPKKIAIREQKTRWGSCSTGGSISLNWKLVMAPLEIVDYVVIHELCHMKVMNHSKEFWDTVGAYFPNYKDCRGWLKRNSNVLDFE